MQSLTHIRRSTNVREGIREGQRDTLVRLVEGPRMPKRSILVILWWVWRATSGKAKVLDGRRASDTEACRVRVEWMDEAERTRRDEKKYERKEEKNWKSIAIVFLSNETSCFTKGLTHSSSFVKLFFLLKDEINCFTSKVKLYQIERRTTAYMFVEAYVLGSVWQGSKHFWF